MKHNDGETLTDYAKSLLHTYLDYVWDMATIESLKNPTESDLQELERMKLQSTDLASLIEAEIGVANFLVFLESAIKMFSEKAPETAAFISKN